MDEGNKFLLQVQGINSLLLHFVPECELNFQLQAALRGSKSTTSLHNFHICREFFYKEITLYVFVYVIPLPPHTQRISSAHHCLKKTCV